VRTQTDSQACQLLPADDDYNLACPESICDDAEFGARFAEIVGSA
jgi:hypothetical protein